MFSSKGVSLKTLSCTIFSGLGLMALSAPIAHANTLYNASAPITYKMDTPYAHAPSSQALSPQAPAPQLTAPQQFDPRRVDPNLHANQRIGNPYTVFGQTYTPAHDPNYDMSGVASWYGDKFHGKPTASGEVYDKRAMTAAHPTLPLNSLVFVTNLDNGRTAIVRINDRGPFKDNRIIDLSEAAAEHLGSRSVGLARVRVQYAGPSTHGINTQGTASANLQAARPVAPAPVVPAQPQAQAQPQYQAEVPDIMMPAPLAPQAYAPRTLPIPQAQSDAANDDIETLTIKGPIHMAVAKGEARKAHLIPAVHRTIK